LKDCHEKYGIDYFIVYDGIVRMCIAE